MGLFHSGIPQTIAVQLAAEADIRNFVETGTFRGGTALWASRHFARVVTIEIYEPLYHKAVERLAGTTIESVLGDSAAKIPGIVASLDGPALFWLDGHYSGENTGGQESECPVLAEIAAIDASPHQHIVMIDDARLFTAPAPAPLRVPLWPSLTETIAALTEKRPDDFIAIHEDVIYRVPPRWKEAFVNLLRVTPSAVRKQKTPWWRKMGRLFRDGA